MRKSIQLLLIVFLLGSMLQPAAAASGLPSGATPGPRRDGIPEVFILAAENTSFELYVHPETLAFKVVDLRSGYIWSSNLDEKADEDRLNRTWTAFAQSGISIDYLDQQAVSKRVSIANTEHTLEFAQIDQGIRAQVTFTEQAISLGLVLTLEEGGVRVEIPFDTIQQGEAFRLGAVHLYPWMAATRGDQTPGYMFIPDGSGSLIHFTAQTKAENMFYGRYYGADLGMLGSLPYDPTLRRPYRMSIPVIGMVHGVGQNAYLAVVENGAAYGEINAHPSGLITNFNFLYNLFVYNESYFQATSRSGDGVAILQPQTNRFDVVMHYRFLTGAEADYVGMARSYQTYLVENGDLQDQTTAGQADIGIRLEFLGAEREKILFWYRTIPMTTIDQMGEILAGLEIGSPEVVYYGWQTRGAAAMPPDHLKLDNALGSAADLRDVVEQVTALGGHFSLYCNPQAALTHESGYNARYDIAMSITRLYLIGYNRQRSSYYFNLEALSDRLGSLDESVQDRLPGSGLALDEMGYMLYSDFNASHFLNRQDSISQYAELLGGLGSRTPLYTPNDYLFGYAAAYYDIPLGGSGYTYSTEAVPFLQIVLSGYVPYYGTALNFSPDLTGDLLRHAEYGAYPSFFVTYEETARILDTSSNWIYISAYQQMKEKIEQSYAWLNNLLGPVQGASIVARTWLAADVVAVTYSNGQQIIVNYSQQPFMADGLTVNARDAILREATP